MTARAVIAAVAAIVSIAAGIATIVHLPKEERDGAHIALIILLTVCDSALWSAIAFL